VREKDEMGLLGLVVNEWPQKTTGALQQTTGAVRQATVRPESEQPCNPCRYDPTHDQCLSQQGTVESGCYGNLTRTEVKPFWDAKADLPAQCNKGLVDMLLFTGAYFDTQNITW
jgi:hypothetical protein